MLDFVEMFRKRSPKILILHDYEIYTISDVSLSSEIHTHF